MIQVLVADESTLARSTLKEIISSSQKLEWIGEVTGFDSLRAFVETRKPDVIITSKNLLSPAKQYMMIEYCTSVNIPSIIFVEKEDRDRPVIKNLKYVEYPDFINFSSEKIKEYGPVLEQHITDVKCSILLESHPVSVNYNAEGEVVYPLQEITKEVTDKTYRAVLIGVSTGGPGTLAALIKKIGQNFPLPILITQHIDSLFDKNLITWLNQETAVPVHLAEDKLKAIAGNVYLAPSDTHLVMDLDFDGAIRLRLNYEPPVNYLRPSVDKMFESAASVLGGNCIAVVLTGMGSDGAKECRHLKDLGAYTITQSESSCVIYGMPKAAYEAGGSCEVLPLDQIAQRLWSLVEESHA